MKVYLVGGAVRDKLLGKDFQDLDYVVTDTTPEELISSGYQKVGESFSVFLHPDTKEEYALPRGKDLKDDLYHRDLTINAMAMDEAENLIDPFNGYKDLKDRVLRHTSPHFADDLLRVYRIFRFKASHPEFNIAPETLELLKELVKKEEFSHIHPDRVIKEIKKVLQTDKPSIFFEGLKEIGALDVLFPELKRLINVPQNPKYHPEGDCWIHTMMVLDEASRLTKDLRVRYACLVHDLGKGITPKKDLPRHIGHEESGVKLVQALGRRILVPNEWMEAAVVVTRFHLKVHRLEEMKDSTIVRMFYEMDAFRKPHLIKILELACQADELGKLKNEETTSSNLEKYFKVVNAVSVKDVPVEKKGAEIGEAIKEERVKRLKAFRKERGQ